MSIKNRRKRKSPFARFGDMPEEPVKKKSATNGKNSQKKGKGKTNSSKKTNTVKKTTSPKKTSANQNSPVRSYSLFDSDYYNSIRSTNYSTRFPSYSSSYLTPSKSPSVPKVALSAEQQYFVDKALEGHNILVDACIGSGKTTAIQRLCSIMPETKRILYLTYNKLLKIDAKSKITNNNATVTNYDGFAYQRLKTMGVSVGIQELMRKFNDLKPDVSGFNVLIIDEYQDIEKSHSEMLTHIKKSNPGIQIIAVGDMQQKIYDKTTLDVKTFIDGFLGSHLELEFTQCFRLSAAHAEMLGRIWHKKIIGVNENCKIGTIDECDVVNFLAKQNPEDVLCLGARTGAMARALNELEDDYCYKYNKKTVYASIREGETIPDAKAAIFTTFDSSKGLERKICVVFDYTDTYWDIRLKKPEQKYEILRNIFCVAASRGKNTILFVEGNDKMLTEKVLSKPHETWHKAINVFMSEMFDFKYKEDIEECFSLLKTKKIPKEDKTPIGIRRNDELIDLSPCVGIYQEAVFFGDYNINKELLLRKLLNPGLASVVPRDATLDEKILYLTFFETRQQRYVTQVKESLATPAQARQIKRRLSENLSPNDEVQCYCEIPFAKEKNGSCEFYAIGFADAVKNETVYELKFVSELAPEHYLQCASYMIGLGLKKGILWNTRNNEMFEITIPNEKKFLDCVTKTMTKRTIGEYYKPDTAKKFTDKFD